MNVVVYDIETRYLVGDLHPFTGQKFSWSRIEDLWMCVGCTWSEEDEHRDWMDYDGPTLLRYLAEHSLAVSFNGFRFDNRVLWGVCNKPSPTPHDRLDGKIVDLLLDVKETLGRLLSLEALAEGTLRTKKEFSAELAPRKWDRGKRLEVIQYCRADVAMTRDLFLFGIRYGHVRYFDQRHREHTLPIQWKVRDAQGRPVRALTKADIGEQGNA